MIYCQSGKQMYWVWRSSSGIARGYDYGRLTLSAILSYSNCSCLIKAASLNFKKHKTWCWDFLNFKANNNLQSDNYLIFLSKIVVAFDCKRNPSPPCAICVHENHQSTYTQHTYSTKTKCLHECKPMGLPQIVWHLIINNIHLIHNHILQDFLRLARSEISLWARIPWAMHSQMELVWAYQEDFLHLVSHCKVVD